MMDVKRTNPNGGRSILVPPKATIKFETAGPKFGPGPEAKPKPAAVQRAGSRQRSAGKDSTHGPDSSRLGTADSGISVSAAGEALLHRRGSGTGEPLLFRRGSGNSVSLMPDPGIALAGAADAVFEPLVLPTATATAGIADSREEAPISTRIGAGAEALSIPDTPPPLVLSDEPPKTEDFGVVSSSNVEIQLSDAVLEAFMQNSPSRTSLLHSPHSHLKPTPAVTHMAKLRVVEEMSRIQARAYVTEQQRAQLMQTALSMDAPKLARRIIQDEKDHDEAVAMPQIPRGIAEGGDRELPHTASAVSFLTAGELLMIDRRIMEEQQIADDLTNADNSFPDVTHTAHGDNDDSGIDENEVTIKRTKSFRKREELQTQEDGRFAKAVEEVERIRQRFIAKAQLPILGSVSNVERVTPNVDLAAARDIYNNIHHNLGTSASTTHVGAKVRKTGNGMLFSSRGSFHIDETPSFAGDLARHHSVHSSGSNSSTTSTNITRQNSKRSDKYAPSGASHYSDKVSLSILAPEDTNTSNAASNYPPLSPAKNGTTAYFPAKRQGSYTINSNTLSPKVDNISGADSVSSLGSHRSNTSTSSANFPSYPTSHNNQNNHNIHIMNTIPDSPSTKAKSMRPVPLLNSGSIENLHTLFDNNNNNNTTNAQYEAPYVNPFEAFERASAAQIVKVGTFEHPSEDQEGGGGTRRGNKLQRKSSHKTSQQLVADDIDDLIGSRFNTARDPLDTVEEAGEILGNSLVLLQQQLDSAAYNKPQQYSRNVSHNHTLENSNIGAQTTDKPKLSTAAATTLSTLARPNSAGKRTNSTHPTTTPPGTNNNYNPEDILSVQITHATPPVHSPPKLSHIEIDPHNPKHYRDQRSVGSGGRGSVGSERSDGRPMLHSDESTSSIGSLMFAFRLDSKSTEVTPASARRDYPNRDPHNITSDTPCSPCSPTGSASGDRGDRGSGSGSRHERGIRNVHEVSRGLFQEHMHQLHDSDSSENVLRPALNSVGSTNSAFSYSEYMYQSSNDSSRLPANYNDHNPTLAPLHAPGTVPTINTNLPVSHALSPLHKPRTPQLQPLPTPTILPHPSNTPITDTATTSPVGVNSSEKRAQRAQLARLSSFGLHNSDSENNPLSTTNSSLVTNVPSTRNTTLSTRNSSLAPRTLSRTRNTIATPTNSASANNNNNSIYNAKIRSAQMLLTSPLSDWLSVGAVHNGSNHNGPNGTTTAGTALPHIEEERHRRSSGKFTFDELHQADSLLNTHSSAGVQSAAPSPSKKNATQNNQNLNLNHSNRASQLGRSGASLTSLLPSLAQSAHNVVDPAALQNVYRSLNVLNSHFSNINSASASSYTTHANSTANLPSNTANTNTSTTNNNSNMIAIDRELDDLLAGNSIPATPRSDPSPDQVGELGISAPQSREVDGASLQLNGKNGTRPNSRGPRVRTTTNLISQSVADVPTQGAGTTFAPLLRPSTSGGGSGSGSTNSTPTLHNAAATTTSTAASDSGKHAYHTGGSGLALSDTTTTPINTAISTSGSITGVDKLSTPVHRELESVITHAKRRERNDNNNNNNNNNTTSKQHPNATTNNNTPHAQDLDHSGSTTSSTNNNNNSLTTTASASATPAESQAQRLGALAAAFEAGDAVGKLMAQMMLMRNNGDASISHSNSNSNGNSGGGAAGSGGFGNKRRA